MIKLLSIKQNKEEFKPTKGDKEKWLKEFMIEGERLFIPNLTKKVLVAQLTMRGIKGLTSKAKNDLVVLLEDNYDSRKRSK